MLDAPKGARYLRLHLRAVIVITTLATAGAACIQPPDPVPVADASELASRLRRAATPDQPQLIEFKWRYRGREGQFVGDGAVRLNPPDSVRLDLLGPDWSGVQSAILLGEGIRYIGEQRLRLPPPTFMWTVLGVFRPPSAGEPQAFRVGERLDLAYRLSLRESVVFGFDAAGQLIGAELRDGRTVVQRVSLSYDARAETTGFSWPVEARYRDLQEFHEVRIEVKEVRAHAPFDRHIFAETAR